MADKGKYLKRILAVMLTLVMSAGLIFTGTPENAYAASPKKLVSKVICYTRVGDSWEKTGVMEFTYNKKGDPVKIYRNNNGYKTVNTYVYSYRKGKKAKAKQYKKEGGENKQLYCIMTYDKAGRLMENTYVDDLTSSVYKYRKNGYITMIDGEDSSDMWMNYRWKGKVPQLLKVKHSDHKGVYTQTVFNKNGLIEKTSCSNARPDGDRRITYSLVNGRVKAIRIAETKGDVRNHYKYVLKYTNKSVYSSRYRAMINYITCRYPVYTGTNWF